MSIEQTPNNPDRTDDFGMPFQVLESVTIDGRPLKVPTLLPVKTRMDAIFSIDSDPAMKAMMKNVMAAKSGGMVDVGANIGQSLAKWATLDPGRSYVGFEPNPASAFLCSLLIRMNGLKNHRLFPVGISEQLGAIRMQLNNLIDPSASFIEAFRPKGFFASGSGVDALVVRGDDVVDVLELKELAFLKIDAEGAELEVLSSFQNTLQGFRPFITFEVLPHYLLVTRQALPEEQVRFRERRYGQIEDLLKNATYHLYDCSGGRRVELVQTILPGPPGSEKALKNYLAVPSESESNLLSNWS